MEKHHEIIMLIVSVVLLVFFGTMFSVSYAKLIEQIQQAANYEADFFKTSDRYIYAQYREANKKIWLFSVCSVVTGFITALSIVVFLFSLMLLNQNI